MWALAQGSKELLNQQDQMERFGRSHLDVLKLTEQAYKDIAKEVPTASIDEVLKTVRELRAVTGDWGKAEALAPKALMADALLGNMAGDSGGAKGYTEFYELMRSAEMKGISTTPAKLDEYTDATFGMIQAFGGKLNAGDFQTLARRGGAAFINSDIQKSLGAIGVMAADLGRPTAGNALAQWCCPNSNMKP
jgi:hypothetical protein